MTDAQPHLFAMTHAHNYSERSAHRPKLKPGKFAPQDLASNQTVRFKIYQAPHYLSSSLLSLLLRPSLHPIFLIEFVDDILMCCLCILQLQEGRQKLLLDEQCISRSCEARVKQLQLVYEGKFEGQRSVFFKPRGCQYYCMLCRRESFCCMCVSVDSHKY